MNILPKKRWHVRSKDNIARVRKDETLAEDIKRKLLNQQQSEEGEKRLSFLRKQKGLPETRSLNNTSSLRKYKGTSKNANECHLQSHLDLFSGSKPRSVASNAEYEIEKKVEKEKYEKQIGYLTYLGQGTNEALKFKSWYELLPERKAVNYKIQEKDAKCKHQHDPLSVINYLLPNHNGTHRILTNRTVSEPPIIPKLTEITPKLNIVHDSITSQKLNKKQYAKYSKEKVKHSIHKNKDWSPDYDVHEDLHDKRMRLEMLRKERLKRELLEKERQAKVLNAKACSANIESKQFFPSNSGINQKYNSQFNPEIAKQNTLKSK